MSKETNSAAGLLATTIEKVKDMIDVSTIIGDPVYTVAGSADLDAEEYDAIYHQLNLDKSTAERFVIWMRDALHGDFGTSYSYSRPSGLLCGRDPVYDRMLSGERTNFIPQ